MKRRIRVITIALASVLAIASISVSTAFAIAQDREKTNSSPTDSKYGKPSVEDIYYDTEGENKEPNDLSSASSGLVVADDEWVKYVEYDDNIISYAYDGNNIRYSVYLPKDIESASIMNINDGVFTNTPGAALTLETIDVNHTSKTFSTGDSITVGYSYSYTYKEDVKVDVKFDFKFLPSVLGLSVNVSGSLSQSHGVSQSYNQTFQAKYYNSNGVAYPWRIVSYNLEMPIRICEEKLSNSKWSIVDEHYTTISLIQGVCRQWRQNGQFYYEDWNTGNPVLDDDFWSGCYSSKEVIDKYKKATLTPNK